jgi:hypothetical protein
MLALYPALAQTVAVSDVRDYRAIEEAEQFGLSKRFNAPRRGRLRWVRVGV